MSLSRKLYHATTRILVPGETIAGKKRKLASNHQAFEDALDRQRPDGFLDRRSCLYAAESPEIVAKYLVWEIPDGTPGHVYEVALDASTRHPMALVNEMFQNASTQRFTKLAAEYWSPTQRWSTYEHLCASMTIVAEVEWPDDLVALTAAGQSYQGDQRLAKSL